MLETSTAERHAGVNVSYENSFSVIRKEIKVSVGQGGKDTTGFINEEKPPNKPKEKLIVKCMAYKNGGGLNQTQEVKPSVLVQGTA